MSTGKPARQGPSIIGALMDFLILVLLVGAAGGGGYYWGTIQRMAPVKDVAPGTPGARPADTQPAAVPADTATAASPDASKKPDKDPDSASGKENTREKEKDNKPTSTGTGEPENTSSSTRKTGSLKYWVCSSGVEYIGYSITLSVNGTEVDNFFGPGKSIDITRYVKPGDNTVSFAAKTLGERYNKHKGDEKSVLTLQLVSGPQIVQDGFKKSDVLFTYKRNAAETEEYSDSTHFRKD